MMTEEFIVKLIGNSAQVGDMDSVAMLTDMLNDMRNPVVEKRTRVAGNKTGYVQYDEAGKEVARYATIKEAVAALNANRAADEQIREDSSCISQACRNFKAGKSNKCYGFSWKYGSDAE